MSPPVPPRPLIPKLVLGAFAILALSWLAFMLHYVLIGSKRQPRPEPVTARTAATNHAPTRPVAR